MINGFAGISKSLASRDVSATARHYCNYFFFPLPSSASLFHVHVKPPCLALKLVDAPLDSVLHAKHSQNQPRDSCRM